MTARAMLQGLGCASLLLLGAVLAFEGAAANGITYDERYYIHYASRIATGGSTCEYKDHPPVAKWLTAAAIAAGVPRTPPWIRLPQIVLFVLLGVLLTTWSAQLYGGWSPLLTAVLYALSPNILAHAGLATTDFPLTVAFTFSVWLLRRFLFAPSAASAALWSVGLACALMTKLTSLVLLPASVATAALVFWRAGVRARPAHLWALVFVPSAFLALGWLVYGMDGCGLASFADAVRVRISQNQSANGVSVYALGQVYPRGVWWYYLVTTALKEPLPLLALAALAVVVRPRATERRAETIILLIPALALFIAASASVHQLGHRYILPAFPLLVLWVSGLAAKPQRAMGVVLCVAAALYTADSLRVRPHFLAYMNQLIGSPDNSYHYLADSNLDWRQDVDSPQIARLRKRWNILNLQRTPLAVRSKKPPALLIGATELSGVWVDYNFWGTTFTRRVREAGYKPAANVGRSMFLFPLDSPELYRDLLAWLEPRSWLDAANLTHRLAEELGLPELQPPVAAAGVPLDLRPCAGGPRYHAAAKGGTWTARWPVKTDAEYLFAIADPARSSAMLDDRRLSFAVRGNRRLPSSTVLRLVRGNYRVRVRSQGPGTEFPLTISRLETDADGYRAATALSESTILCPPDP